MMSLINAPSNTPLKIVSIMGGEGARRRLFSLGLHKNDVIELNSFGIFHGPVLIRNLNTDASVALGRGIAQKIMVELVDAQE